METPKRYAPALIFLHWLIAALIFLMLGMGFTRLGASPNDAAKVSVLRLHMPLGISILALMLVRLMVRFFSRKPAPATAGNPWLDKIGVLVHILLYVGAIGMGVSGLGISAQAGLAAIVFEGQGSLPADFSAFPPALGHGLTAFLLSGLILLHIGAALYHQFVRKDHLLARMGIGNSEE